MADEMGCGDFGLTYSCKYVICVEKISIIEQRSYVIFVVLIHFALLFAIRTKVVRTNIKVILL